eukprot:425180-Prymnesium_polylepis.2
MGCCHGLPRAAVTWCFFRSDSFKAPRHFVAALACAVAAWDDAVKVHGCVGHAMAGQSDGAGDERFVTSVVLRYVHISIRPTLQRPVRCGSPGREAGFNCRASTFNPPTNLKPDRLYSTPGTALFTVAGFSRGSLRE